MPDRSPIEFKGGRLPADPSKPRLTFAGFKSTQLPPAPPSIDLFSEVADWPMYLNNSIGDCTIATVGHMVESWTTYGQRITKKITDNDVLKAYEAVSGYDPKTKTNDNGAVVQDVLNYWRKTGIGGTKIVAFASVDVKNIEECKQAAAIFGGIYLGINFPASAMDQFNRGEPWDVVKGSTNEGGHAIPSAWYDTASGLWKVITWGAVQPMTQAFWEKYCVASDTPVLTDSLEWVPVGKLTKGDGLVVFDEQVERGQHRRLKRGEITGIRLEVRDCVEIELSDGTSVTCTPEHRFLVTTGDGHKRWVRADRLRVGGKYASKIVKVMDTWEQSDTYESGYLSAAFDGEGCVSQSTSIRDGFNAAAASLSFAQRDNAMLKKTRNFLDHLGFDYSEYVSVRDGYDDVHRLQITKKRDVLRFLGEVRPERLLKNISLDRLGSVPGRRGGVEVVARQDVGPREIAVMSTDAKTFIANGLASHNCEEAWAVISEDFFDPSTGKNPAGLDFYALGEQFTALTGEPNPFPQPSPQPSPSPSPQPGPAPTPAPAPTPEPSPTDPSVALGKALKRYVATKSAASYLKGPAEAWLAQQK